MVNLNLVPYIPLAIEYPAKAMFDEISNLGFFDYREWKSVTLYGLSPDKNLSYRHYHVDPNVASKQWFFEKECPVTLNWLRNQFIFVPDRIRAWHVSPNQSSGIHTDASSAHDRNLILPLNHPKGFKSSVAGFNVPFDQGAMIYNNFLPHEFSNQSLESRYTLIIRVKEWNIPESIPQLLVDNKSVKEISWETFITYLYRSKHVTFDHMRSTNEYCEYLADTKSVVRNPKYKFYGLYDYNELVGVTSLCEYWDGVLVSSNTIRYRYIFIDPRYRGQNLAKKLLDYVTGLSEWQHCSHLIGYASELHINWCLHNGFRFLTSKYSDNHAFMIKDL